MRAVDPESDLEEFAARRALARLGGVGAFRFEARWIESDGAPACGQGEGRVTVVRTEGPDGVVLEEAGFWSPRPGTSLRFRGAYRWRVTPGGLSVAHLRRGVAHPVPLVDMVPADDGAWHSPRPHLCGDDEYHARLTVQPDHVTLHWKAQGPAKDYTVVTTYT